MNVSLEQWFIVDDVGERTNCNQNEFLPEKQCRENIFSSHFNLSFPHFETLKKTHTIDAQYSWIAYIQCLTLNTIRLGLDCEMNDDQICKCFSKYLIEMRDRKLYPSIMHRVSDILTTVIFRFFCYQQQNSNWLLNSYSHKPHSFH